MTSSPATALTPPTSAQRNARSSPAKRRGEAPSPQPQEVRDLSLLRNNGAFHLKLGEFAELPGVYITERTEGTLTIPAHGLRSGDRILAIDNEDVSTWTRRELIDRLKAIQGECQLRVSYDLVVGGDVAEALR